MNSFLFLQSKTNKQTSRYAAFSFYIFRNGIGLEKGPPSLYKMTNGQWPLTLYCGIGLSKKVTPGGTNVVTNQGINNRWRPLVLLLHLLCRNPGDLTNLTNLTNCPTWPTWPTWSTWSTSSTWPTWVNGVRLFLTLLNYIKLDQIRLNWYWGRTKEKTTAMRMLECFKLNRTFRCTVRPRPERDDDAMFKLS